MAACQNLEWNMHRISAHLLPTNSQELTRIVARCRRECLLTNSVLLLDCDEVNLAEGMRKTTISQFIEGVETPLILSTEERMPVRHRSQISLDVRKLTHQERFVIWKYSLGPLADELDDYINELVVQFNLSTMAIVTASWQIQNYSLSAIPEKIDDKDDNISRKQITESENLPTVED
ncbi:ATP-binding protein, partial [Symplocastrum sp. BBK-W-15]|nr:ATP-binding protein [Limnofasciculus baicalensis BBK-W-15]